MRDRLLARERRDTPRDQRELRVAETHLGYRRVRRLHVDAGHRQAAPQPRRSVVVNGRFDKHDATVTCEPRQDLPRPADHESPDPYRVLAPALVRRLGTAVRHVSSDHRQGECCGQHARGKTWRLRRRPPAFGCSAPSANGRARCARCSSFDFVVAVTIGDDRGSRQRACRPLEGSAFGAGRGFSEAFRLDHVGRKPCIRRWVRRGSSMLSYIAWWVRRERAACEQHVVRVTPLSPGYEDRYRASQECAA